MGGKAIRGWLAVALVLGLGAGALAQERSLRIEPAKPPAGERRLALIIGNSAYKDAPLRNPVNDARAMAKALEQTGFRVTLVENARRSTMRRAIREWGDELAAGGVALFYFAGHGMQIRGRNYLIPVGADIQRENEVEDESVDANTVLAKLDSVKNSLNLVILDACRNNPFARSFRSSQQGLAQMDAPSGTLVAFATAPGSVAADGDGDNGLYTQHLLQQMRIPGLSVEELFKRVRIGVTGDTGDRQVPWESSSLKGDFYFVPPDLEAGKRAQQAAIDRAVRDAEARARKEREQLQSEAARERAALEEKMRQLMEQLLAAQRAEVDAQQLALQRQREALEAERQKGLRAEAPPVDPAPAALAVATPPAPVPQPEEARTQDGEPLYVASMAPEPPSAAVLASPLPKIGDWWTYRARDINRDEKRQVQDIVEVHGVTGGGVLERSRRGLTEPTQWVHGAGPYIVGSVQGAILFSPHIGAFETLQAGQRWEDVRFSRMKFCETDNVCRFTATVAGEERVAVEAGEFDAWRIDVHLAWETAAGRGLRGGQRGERRYRVWYAPAAKRAVKVTSREGRGEASFEPEMDLELIAYELR
jgi:uncharacterized caspase-like protein